MDRNIQPWALHGKKGFCFKLFLQNSSNWNPDLIRVNQSDTTQGPGYNQPARILYMSFLQIQFLCCFCYYFCELADFGHGYFRKVYYFGGVTVVTFGQEEKFMLYMYMQDASGSELLILNKR